MHGTPCMTERAVDVRIHFNRAGWPFMMKVTATDAVLWQGAFRHARSTVHDLLDCT